jgi:hypothetical protein
MLKENKAERKLKKSGSISYNKGRTRKEFLFFDYNFFAMP